MSREHIYTWVQSVATHLQHIFDIQKRIQKQLSQHKNWQSENCDLQNRRLIPVTFLTATTQSSMHSIPKQQCLRNLYTLLIKCNNNLTLTSHY